MGPLPASGSKPIGVAVVEFWNSASQSYFRLPKKLEPNSIVLLPTKKHLACPHKPSKAAMNSTTRLPWRAGMPSNWACLLCRRARAQLPRKLPSRTIRHGSSSSSQTQHRSAAPPRWTSSMKFTETEIRRRCKPNFPPGLPDIIGLMLKCI